MFRHTIVMAVLLCVGFTENSVAQDDNDSQIISGIVIEATGARLTIALENGEQVSATLAHPISAEEIIGETINSEIIPAGDTKVLIEPVFGE